MTTTRSPLRILLTLFVAIGIIGSTALLARAYEQIEFTHKPGQASFHNPNDVAAEINYGRASSGDVLHVTVPPGETVSVIAADQHFGFEVTINGETVQELPWPGVDLSAAKYEQANPDKEPLEENSTKEPAEENGNKKPVEVEENASGKPSLPSTGN